MTQSFEENINDNFEAAKSAIANCAPLTLVQTVNNLIQTVGDVETVLHTINSGV